MTNYLIRRLFQMMFVVFFSAAASYALLNLAPGGPTDRAAPDFSRSAVFASPKKILHASGLILSWTCICRFVLRAGLLGSPERAYYHWRKRTFCEYSGWLL